jgi:hypothetical protein
LVDYEEKFLSFLYLVNINNSLPNGYYTNGAGDASPRGGAPTGWINALAGGGGAVAGVGGQSAISQKSGRVQYFDERALLGDSVL